MIRKAKLNKDRQSTSYRHATSQKRNFMVVQLSQLDRGGGSTGSRRMTRRQNPTKTTNRRAIAMQEAKNEIFASTNRGSVCNHARAPSSKVLRFVVLRCGLLVFCYGQRRGSTARARCQVRRRSEMQLSTRFIREATFWVHCCNASTARREN